MASTLAKLFVARVPAAVDNRAFGEFFAQFGAIKSARVVFDHESGRSKGFGFVEFEDPAVAQELLSRAEPPMIDGRTVVVRQAIDRDPSEARGDGGEGSGRRFGGAGGNSWRERRGGSPRRPRDAVEKFFNAPLNTGLGAFYD